jgi:hypothetical protein
LIDKCIICMHLSIFHKVGLDFFRTYDLEQYAITTEHK